jgi:hypothetical protein
MLISSRRLLQQVIPTESVAPSGQIQDTDIPADSMPAFAERPGFTIPTMSNNFRRFNARIGVVFKFQARMIRLLSWRRSSQTLSFLAVYTFVCLDPYLLTVLPLVIVLLAILVPSFVARHPAAPSAPVTSSEPYSARGPPLAPARTVKPVKELSRDFFRNMRDLQNSMDDFSKGHDQVVSLLLPLTNFSDEALSSALFVVLTVACLTLSIAAHLLPWRAMFLIAGWAVTLSGHPTIARMLARDGSAHLAEGEQKARSIWQDWIARDIILDEAPETREVEIFELQKRIASSDEWEAWLFSPGIYEPLAASRIAGERPKGTRFFEDVRPPAGWEWSEKKWVLDLWSREWVEERIITGVEVETEGERWVYDMWREDEGATGVIEERAASSSSVGIGSVASEPSWEEGLEGVGKRGDWRRRRWVRMVKRRQVDPGPS